LLGIVAEATELLLFCCHALGPSLIPPNL